MEQHSIEKITSLLVGEYQIRGNDSNRSITELGTIWEATPDSLTWVAATREDKYSLVEKSQAGIILCDPSFRDHPLAQEKSCLITVDDPKLNFVKVGNGLFSDKLAYGIHPTAVIDPAAQIHPNVYIGPHTYVGQCTIDEGTVIYGNCYLYDGATIGENVTINAGTVIGAAGFGYVKNENGEYENFPHVGGVIIEDNVEIGANTTVDRGSLGNTIIREWARVDNLVHVAHNVVIGRHALVIANAMIGGSTEIGDYAWVAPSVTLRDAISVGQESIVGLGAVVVKSVPEKSTVMGAPARIAQEYKQLLKALKNLIS